ncbi:MAG TPA: efflux RND transporter permease subunit [Gammaproteobacteria bacterium]
MNALIRAFVDRPSPVLFALAILMIAGATAYVGIPKESEPDIAIPTLYANITHEGISPEDAERLLVRPMENELRTIDGLEEMRATAAEGSAVLVLEFDAGFDPEQALADVREKVDIAKAELPAGTDEPWVREINVALFPVLVVQLHGDVPERALVRIARDLRDTLEGLPGVLQVDIAGDREELLEVIVDPVRLESYGLGYVDLLEYVSRNNRLVAAGALDTGSGRFSVKVPGVFEDVQALMSLPIKTVGQTTVTFADVAEIRRTFKDPSGFARLDGERTIALEVSKRIGANIVDVVDDVKRTVLEEQRSWPENVNVTFTQDGSEDVRMMLRDLQNNVITAVLLVMIVTLASLGLRSSALVGISVPGSFLAGILVIWALGLSINIVVLFSLIMAVGMLVDGATIVVELADRNLAAGHSRKEAYVRAAQRMAAPVIASVATTLAAFVPLLFWPGVIGEFMVYLPITLLVTLTASLVMALLFVPTIGSLLGRRPAAAPAAVDVDAEATLANLGPGTAAYIGLLRRALAHPGKVVLGACALLTAAYVAYAQLGRGVEFFPDIEPTQANINIRARGDLSVHERDELVRRVEERILDMPELESVYARSGLGLGDSDEADVIGRIQVRFIDWKLRRPAAEILAEVRQRTADIAGIVVEPQGQESGVTSGKPIQIEVASRLPELLDPAVERIIAGMREIGGIIDITDSRTAPGIDWRIEVDRAQAARFGADVTMVGSAIQLVTNGIMIGDYRPNDADDEVDIRVRFPDADRNITQLDRLRLNTASGPVPVGNFVTRTAAQRTGEIERVDGRRVLTISADVAPGVLADDKVREIERWLAGANLDPAVQVRFRGENEDQREAEAFLGNAFAAALFLIAIILVVQFNSFYQALLILTAVVFSTIGVLLGLLITDQPFGVVMCGIGIISLAGIVVSNNIVLIDTYNIMRRRSLPVLDAILLTCSQRLRPVMLTTVTTILGLLPIVFGLNVDVIGRSVEVGGPSSQWWMQLSTAIAGGLTFATCLTLVLTPCLLLLGARASARLASLAARLRLGGTDAVPHAGEV